MKQVIGSIIVIVFVIMGIFALYGEAEEEVKLSGWLKAQVEQKLSEEEERVAKELNEKNFFPKNN